MSNAYIHLKALLKKNWILFKRSPLTSFCEILIPILLVFVLVGVRSLVTMDDQKETSYIENPTNFTVNPVISPFIYDFIEGLPYRSDNQILALELLYRSFNLK